MEFRELAMTRRSVRKFRPEPVPKSEIVDIISTAISAPSAGNEQMWHFTVLTEAALKQQLAQIIIDKLAALAEQSNTCDQPKGIAPSAIFFKDAPCVIAVTTGLYRSKADNLLEAAGYSDQEIDVLRCRPDLQSIGAVIQMVLLAAWEKGYGTCWMTGPMVGRPELEACLNVEKPRSLAALIALGKPEFVPASRGRKPIEEVITFLD
jgi:nitroreductase